MPEPQIKSLKRTIAEFGSVIFISNHCLICQQLVEKRKLLLIKWDTNVNIDTKEYLYFGVPACKECMEKNESRASVVKKVDKALEVCPFKLLVG